METNPTTTSNAGTNRNLIIGIVIAIVLCCCCAITTVAGYYGYQGYVQAQQLVQDFEDFEIPTSIPGDPNQLAPEFDVNGDFPEGGLTDDDTRLRAWFSLQIVLSVSDCQAPTAQGTTITVVQQPDGNGEWVEEWDVDCGDGTSQPFNLTFTPENGFVNISEIARAIKGN